jgi:hypothetical protein
VDGGLGITFIVVLQLSQVDDHENAETRAQNCLVIVEGTKRKADPRIEVA